MAQLHGHDVRLFALSSNYELAKEISDYIGLAISDCTIQRFADGEINVDIKDTVRGHDCFIVQSTSNPVNEHYMELFIMIDALKRASAKTINIIMPYYGYCRQDRKVQARQPISSKLMADLLTKAGASRVFSMDLHASQIQGFFDIPIDNFAALPVMVSYIKKHMPIEDLVIVSPDHGGASRARRFADNFSNSPIAIIDKRRPKPNVAEVMSIVGDVKGKDCILVDDIIDTAGSAVAAAEALEKAGAKSIHMCVTHALLNGPAIERIKNSSIQTLIVSNTVKLSDDKKLDNIVQLSVAKIFGQGILNVLDNKPLSTLFKYDPNNDFDD